MPFDYSSLLNEDDSEDDSIGGGILPRRQYQGMYGGSDEIPPLDQNDPAAKMYLAHASSPMPSEGLLKDYLARRPDERSQKYQGNFGQKLLSGVFNLLGQKGASERLMHPGFQDAYSDWQTEGKLIPQMARSADLTKQKELEAEKFNIIGTAKGKQQAETIRKNKATETSRAEVASAKAAKDKELSDAKAKAEARAEGTATRSEKYLSLAEQREARAEAEAKAKKEDPTNKKLKETLITERNQAAYKNESADLEDTVKNEISSNPHWSKYFTIDKDGNTTLTDEGKASGMDALAKYMIGKRKKALKQKYGLGE